MSRLWDRGSALDQTIERFTVGRDPELDLELLRFDALASYAHASMLKKIDILSAEELDALKRELKTIVEEANARTFAIERQDEDGHTAIENRLTERLGETGKKIHTGRSRNDQVIAALRLFGRELLTAVAEEITSLAERLIELADEHRETTCAGYTHTRQAMPSTLGHLFAAHAEGLLDTKAWIETAYHHLNRSPLGSASGYGVSLALDREYVAKLLAFDSVQHNSIAVQNDRGKTEFLVLSAIVAPALDMGRLATDLIFFSSDELKMIHLDPKVTTGSSIMPQKRNPDVLELVRATSARLRSRQMEIASIYGALPSGYQRDLQLTKEPFVLSLLEALDLFAAMRAALNGISVDKERAKAILLETTGATDEVYRRVGEGEAFRNAYKAVAKDPDSAMQGRDLKEAWRMRNHIGSPADFNVDVLRHAQSEFFKRMNQWKDAHESAWRILDE